MPHRRRSVRSVLGSRVRRQLRAQLSLKWLIVRSTEQRILYVRLFIHITYRTGIQAKIPFRIDVDHTSGLRRCARILTVADTMIVSVLAFVPGHLWADEFECWNTTTQMGSVPLRFHR